VPAVRRLRALGAAALVACLTTAVLTAASPAEATITPGWIDPAYGVSGVGLAADLDPGNDSPTDAVVDGQGRAVFLSRSSVPGQETLARLTVAGAVDQSFGTAGLTRLPAGPDFFRLTVGQDGIYVVGIPADGNGVAVARLTPNGQVDPTYGGTGLVILPVQVQAFLWFGVTQLDNGNLAVVGTGHTTPPLPGGDLATFLAEVTPAGKLNTAFNNTGAVPGVVSLPAIPLMLTHDGNQPLVLQNSVDDAQGPTIRRFTTTGANDLTIQLPALPIGNYTRGLDVGPNGDYYVTGGGSQPNAGFVRAYLRTGAPDTHFGAAGLVTLPLRADGPLGRSVAVSGSSVYVFGVHQTATFFDGRPLVVRLHTDGTLDDTFGGGGILQAATDPLPGGASVDSYVGAGLQPDGRPLLLMTMTTSTSPYSPGALRLNATSIAPAGAYVPLVPSLLFDSHTGFGIPAAPLAAHQTATVKVAGRAGVPTTGVGAVVLNLTASGATTAGTVTVFPKGLTKPVGPSVSFAAGQTVANLVTTALGTGSLRVNNGSTGTVDVAATVAGYYRSGTVTAPGAFVSLTPTRILDTRKGIGAPMAPVAPQAALSVQVDGVGGVPVGGAATALLDVTVSRGAQAGDVTAFPTGTARPAVSMLSHGIGQTLTTLVPVQLGSGGRITLYNDSLGKADLAADVVGYYVGGTASAPGTFVSLRPSRVVDTTTGIGTGGRPAGPLAGGQGLTSHLAGTGGLPTRASAVVLMGAAQQGTAAGDLTFVGADQFLNTRSFPDPALSYPPAATVSNLTINSGLDIHVINNGTGSVQAQADVEGYFLP
jgi:uncharacterized delta-60 repeat protein